MRRFTQPYKSLFVLLILVMVMALPGLAELPVIDRDEALFVQSSVQMYKSGDYIHMKFQDQSRLKKPAGAYWLQTVMLHIANPQAGGTLWAQRLPSVLGALLAVLATFWAGRQLLGQRAAFVAAMLLALSLLLVFEAHIAKTDALLCGLSAAALACLAELRKEHLMSGTQPIYVIYGFWIICALGVLLKGLNLVVVIGLCGLCLWIWERHLKGLSRLWHGGAILTCLIITVPWFVLISIVTEGAFFKQSLMADFAAKLVSVQEGHGGFPGMYLVTLSIFFWPGSLFLFMGVIWALRTAFLTETAYTPMGRTARLLLCWSVPIWFVLELLPTKLPHYILPTFPALALMCAAALEQLHRRGGFEISRRLGAGMMIVVSSLICTVLLYVETLFGHEVNWLFFVVFPVLLVSIISAYGLWTARVDLALWAVFASAVVLSGVTYRFVFPNLTKLHLSARIEKILKAADIHPLQNLDIDVLSPHFTEPSLVYYLGQDIKLGHQVDFTRMDWRPKILLINRLESQTAELMAQAGNFAAMVNRCWLQLARVEGMNYSKAQPVELEIFHLTSCPQTDAYNQDPDQG